MLFPDYTLVNFYSLSDLFAQQMPVVSLVAMCTVYAIGRLAFGGWQDNVESASLIFNTRNHDSAIMQLNNFLDNAQP